MGAIAVPSDAYYGAQTQRSLRRRSSQSEQRSARRRVVVVEQALPATALAAMEERGMQVTKVRSADEALRCARAGEADLLLCDMAGAAGDGLALCRELGKQASRQAVVLLTSRGTSADFDQAIEAGAARAIAKPCSHEALLALLVRQLEPEAQLGPSRHAARPSRPSQAPRAPGLLAVHERASAA